MKIDNFVLIERRGDSILDFEYLAEVDVTTGFIFKKTERKEIYKKHGCHWCFSESGKYTPDFLAERAQRAFEAKHGCITRAYVLQCH